MANVNEEERVPRELHPSGGLVSPGRTLYEQWCGNTGADRERYYLQMNGAAQDDWERLASEVVPAEALREAREELERLRELCRENGLDYRASPKDSVSASQPVSDGSKRRWWVQSDEDDGRVVRASTDREAVERWAKGEWQDVEDGQTVEALDLALLRKFVIRQTNEIADEDLETLPKFEFVSDPSASGSPSSNELRAEGQSTKEPSNGSGSSLASEPKLDGSGR